VKADDLKTILADHVKWLMNENGGKRAYLQSAYLQGAYLQGANLQDANLQGANLQDANLRGANLQGANLQSAYLQGANLQDANLQSAYLQDAYLQGANLQDANLQSAYLQGANLQDANLQSANLQDANLRGAYLQSAYLQSAYLQSANLRGAYLGGAYLGGAKGVNKYRTTNLYLLADQVGKIRAYKLVNAEYEGPMHGGIKYEVGKTYEVGADPDENTQCSYGISLADLPWCMNEWREGYRILLCEFTAKDIAAIPVASDGKFRVSKCKVIREMDLSAYEVAPVVEVGK
jgi:hypothetical protein